MMTGGIQRLLDDPHQVRAATALRELLNTFRKQRGGVRKVGQGGGAPTLVRCVASGSRRRNEAGALVGAPPLVPSPSAERRCGELLKVFRNAGSDHRSQAFSKSGAPPLLITQRQAAAAAGISKDQARQAVRVANVPADVFEAAVESIRVLRHTDPCPGRERSPDGRQCDPRRFYGLQPEPPMTKFAIVRTSRLDGFRRVDPQRLKRPQVGDCIQ